MKYLLLSLTVLSCTVYGPKTRDKSLLNKLNGNNYHSDVATALSPVAIQRISRATTLSGLCFFKIKNDDLKYPVRFKEVVLLKDKRVIAKTNTDHEGKFKISSNIDDGKYTLALEASNFHGSTEIEVRGYSLADLDLEAQKP